MSLEGKVLCSVCFDHYLYSGIADGDCKPLVRWLVQLILEYECSKFLELFIDIIDHFD